MSGKKKDAPGGTPIKPHINDTTPGAKCHAQVSRPFGHDLNVKPMIIDNFRLALFHIPESTVISIKRISWGIVGTDNQVEKVRIAYRVGAQEEKSILNMTPDEAFITICSMIAEHAALAGAKT